jgi:hypothetical protein
MPRQSAPEPAHKRTPRSDSDSPPTHRGPSATRRQVIVGAAAAGVTVAAAGAAVEAFAGAALAAGPSGHGSVDQVVAHVRDVRSGQIDVFVGDRQVTIRDRGVANRLARAAE